jgi:hypothetical protein
MPRPEVSILNLVEVTNLVEVMFMMQEQVLMMVAEDRTPDKTKWKVGVVIQSLEVVTTRCMVVR